MAKQTKSKTVKDKLSANSKFLTGLLIHEASGGIIPLPEGAEGYVPPKDISFDRRCNVVELVIKLLLADKKIDPTEEMSGMELLKEELDGRTSKRNIKSGNRADPLKINGSESLSGGGDSSTDEDLFPAGTA